MKLLLRIEICIKCNMIKIEREREGKTFVFSVKIFQATYSANLYKRAVTVRSIN